MTRERKTSAGNAGERGSERGPDDVDLSAVEAALLACFQAEPSRAFGLEDLRAATESTVRPDLVPRVLSRLRRAGQIMRAGRNRHALTPQHLVGDVAAGHRRGGERKREEKRSPAGERRGRQAREAIVALEAATLEWKGGDAYHLVDGQGETRHTLGSDALGRCLSGDRFERVEDAPADAFLTLEGGWRVAEPSSRRRSGVVGKEQGVWVIQTGRGHEPMLLDVPESMTLEVGQSMLADAVHRSNQACTWTGWPRFPLVAVPLKSNITPLELSRESRPSDLLREMPRGVETMSEALDTIAALTGADSPFSPEAWAEAEAARAPEDLEPGDRDLRELPLVTIDGETAKDFDDAVHAWVDGELVVLLVAIADVSWYVREGSILDEEARRRASSVYLPGRVYPMLPPALSEDVCSLRPKVLRRCLWVEMVLDPEGMPVAWDVGSGVMRSAARLTYGQVDAFLTGREVHLPDEIADSLGALQQARVRLQHRRRERGMLDLDLPQPSFRLTPDGEDVHDVSPEPRLEAHRLIEECMLAANETVATHLKEQGYPSILRVHLEPDPERWAKVHAVASQLGIAGVQESIPDAHQLGALLDSVKDKPEARVLSWLILRGLPPARYTTEDHGHFGIGAERYLHFTSPIRRYADLENHRMVRALLKAHRPPESKETERKLRERLSASAQASNHGDRVAVMCERAAGRVAGALFMRNFIGCGHDALVSDVQRSGLFVSLEDPLVDAFLPYASIPGGPWQWRPERGAATSQSGAVLSVGAYVQVVTQDVEIGSGRVTVGYLAMGRAGRLRPAAEVLRVFGAEALENRGRRGRGDSTGRRESNRRASKPKGNESRGRKRR